jgi:hypothetical protein
MSGRIDCIEEKGAGGDPALPFARGLLFSFPTMLRLMFLVLTAALLPRRFLFTRLVLLLLLLASLLFRRRTLIALRT